VLFLKTYPQASLSDLKIWHMLLALDHVGVTTIQEQFYVHFFQA